MPAVRRQEVAARRGKSGHGRQAVGASVLSATSAGVRFIIGRRPSVSAARCRLRLTILLAGRAVCGTGVGAWACETIDTRFATAESRGTAKAPAAARPHRIAQGVDRLPRIARPAPAPLGGVWLQRLHNGPFNVRHAERSRLSASGANAYAYPFI